MLNNPLPNAYITQAEIKRRVNNNNINERGLVVYESS